ncbi:MAG TPA: CHASE3 domain-containing protein [Terriglobales bacterium]|nr:CHASE3 domain-containing protein [Terriglobales bacterium]
MSSSTSARVAFATGITLLVICGVLVYITLTNFAASERWVEHSQQVRELLGQTESDIASAARARLIYVFQGNNDSLEQYQRSAAQIPEVLANLRKVTADNPVQQRSCERLEALVNTRIQLWEKSIALKQSGASEPAGQPEMTRQSVEFANDIVNVTREMTSEESQLLAQRRSSARAHFLVLIAAIAVSFSAAVLLLLWHYRRLQAELQAREQAEQAAATAARAALESEQKAYQAERAALASHEAARRLSARLLQSRDDERRRLSRELHDSIGQYLAAAKMILSGLRSNQADPRYQECINLIDQSMKEIRTLSHLLHPPGLDEAGFSAAARWYLEEFAKRSGLDLRLDIKDPPDRLPAPLELALFRVVQESVTNIHRHSQSESAEVRFDISEGCASLIVTDRGVGVPQEILARFKASGTSGVGLAGMRERIRELGGSFEVESGNDGTRVTVSIPLARSQESALLNGELRNQALAADQKS